jgi:NAD(P)H-hydrate epimerase
MRVLTATQMREADRRTIDELGIPARVLMERAGRHVAEAVERRFAPLEGKRIAVVCGRGNNGGDGFVAARVLVEHGRAAQVFVIGAISGVKGEAVEALERLQAAGVEPIALDDASAWPRHREGVTRADVVIDAITGTGFTPPLTGLAATIVSDLNAARRPVVAVDLPSGLSADTARVTGEAVEATVTVALAAPKVPHVLAPAETWAGEWHVADIGIPAAVIDEVEGPRLEVTTPDTLREIVKPRPRNSHKGHFGHVLVVAGSRGKTGAAYLTAIAALRSGAGLVTVATPASCVPAVASFAAELMTLPLPEDEQGRLTSAALDAILAFDADVIAAGPGLGRSAELDSLMAALVERSKAPLVIDADGLNAFTQQSDRLRARDDTAIVITPHPGEMATLTGQSIERVQADRLAAATAFAGARRLHVVLKGYRTLVTAPDGSVAINPTGNPGMATAGTGDVLTGIVAAWLAQLRQPWLACRLAAYLHGRAGDLAAAASSEIAMIAGDVVAHLGPAVLELTATPPAGGR